MAFKVNTPDYCAHLRAVVCDYQCPRAVVQWHDIVAVHAQMYTEQDVPDTNIVATKLNRE